MLLKIKYKEIRSKSTPCKHQPLIIKINLSKMKKSIILLILFLPLLAYSQAVGVNNTGATPDPSSILDIASSDKGVLVPRLLSTERNAISNAAEGLLVYDTDESSFYYYTNSAWKEIAGNTLLTMISDDDADTNIETEQSPDDDNIRFVVKGTEFARMDGNSFHLGVPNGSIFIGKDAGLNDDGTNNNNTALGFEALKNDATGQNNTAIGFGALSINDAGNSNIAIGVKTMRNTHNGDFNIAIGNAAMFDNTSGAKNVALGHQALVSNTTGELNIAIGANALSESLSRNNNIAIGDSALFNNGLGASNSPIKDGANNIAIGIRSGINNKLGYGNVLLGNETYSEGSNSSFNNTIIGHSAGKNTGDGENVMIGAYAGQNFNGGQGNVFVGNSAGRNNLTHQNTFLGSGTGKNVEGAGNVFIGYQTGENLIGDNQLAIDNSSTNSPLIYGDFIIDMVQINGTLNINDEYDLPIIDGNANEYLRTNGAGNTSWSSIDKTKIKDLDGDTNIEVEKTADDDIIRFRAGGQNILTMSRNGQDGYLVEPSANNTLYGNQAGVNFFNSQFGGLGNTAIGVRAGEQNEDGNDNVYLGEDAGQMGEDVAKNTFIGTRSGQNNYGSNNIFIGHEAGKDENGANKLIIDNTNTSTPLIKGDFNSNVLTINGSLEIGSEYVLPLLDGTADQLLRTDGIGNLDWVADNAGPWTVGSGDINYSGQVGIGTSNPDHQLSVLGSESDITGDDGVFIDVQNSNTILGVLTGIRFRNGTTPNTFKGGIFYKDKEGYGRGDILFINNNINNGTNATAADAAMTIQPDGDIIIGTQPQAVGYKLSIDGKMACEEVLVELSGDWPDYVFGDEYKLMPLNVVETFIKNEGHLPNIPTAKEVEKNGLEVGDMQRKLMEKVEELTLYIIELDKQNKILNQKIVTLESVVSSSNK